MIKDIYQKFFFKIPQKQKKEVKLRLLKQAHFYYIVVCFFCIFLEGIMLTIMFAHSGFKIVSVRGMGYRSSYLFLIIMMIISAVWLIRARKKLEQNPKTYVAGLIFLFFSFSIWSLVVSFLDSFKVANFNVVTYTFICLSMFGSLSPFFHIIVFLLELIVLDLFLFFSPFVEADHFSIIMNSFSIWIISSMTSLTVYNIRIREKIYEIEKENYIEEINYINDRLHMQVTLDGLTGVGNRHYLNSLMNKELKFGNSCSGVILFDIDFFKEFNDKHGHLNGDICLQNIGTICNDFCDNEEKSFVIRYGGEEFLVFFEELPSGVLEEKARKLHNLICSSSFKINTGELINITISVGCCEIKEGQNFRDIIDAADRALYQAKRNGRNCIVSSNN